MEKKMHELRALIKRKKIPVSYLVEATGYSRCHLSSVLNGLKPCTPQFYRLLSIALTKILREDVEELNHTLEELWKPPC